MGGRGQQITDISFSSDLPNSAKDSSYQKLAAQESGFVILKLKAACRPVTKLRISIVQYLNTAPLVWGFTNGPLRGKYDLSFTVPSQCAEQGHCLEETGAQPADHCQEAHRTGEDLCAGRQFAQHADADTHPVRGKVADCAGVR